MGLLSDLVKSLSAHANPPPVRSRVVVTAAATLERQRKDLRAGDVPPGCRILAEGPALQVVGESNYVAAIEAVVGRYPGGHADTVDAVLVREPKNRYDPNAIAVQLAERTVGYLSRSDAVRYGPVLARAAELGFSLWVRAYVKGGWCDEDGAWGNYGVTLYVASPEKLLAALAGPAA